MTENQKRLINQFTTSYNINKDYINRSAYDSEVCKYIKDISDPIPDGVYGYTNDQGWIQIGMLPPKSSDILLFGFIYPEDDTNINNLSEQELNSLEQIELQTAINDYAIVTSVSRVGKPVFWVCSTKHIAKIIQTDPILDTNIRLTQYNTINRVLDDGNVQTIFCYNTGEHIIPEPEENEDPTVDFKYMLTLQ